RDAPLFRDGERTPPAYSSPVVCPMNSRSCSEVLVSHYRSRGEGLPAGKLNQLLPRRQERIVRETEGRARAEGAFGRPLTTDHSEAAMALALNIGKCTLTGNVRDNNEDALDVQKWPDTIVCLVADGMGGQAHGEIASQKAVEIVPRGLRKYLHGAAGDEETKTIIRRAIVQANDEIMAIAALDREMKSMGTTIVVSVW